ncbi:sterol desaturase family protein [Pseudomaricurvus sp. HS19]|uniref:sterol desaturase family protein n=1 Tax=Pseudomaricurvus sp. HS19 TaxID=2692626 RepID=UPI00136F5365|nr:sterol desaturase family protein [Pseudomaricurvus sp. HS19]MYM64462.1 sterol desaturase family protein [Pseudomaricurvus sp. HS19]
MNWIENEGFWRLLIFIAVFMLMYLLERLRPRRHNDSGIRASRWLGNLSLALINTLAIRVLFPAAAVGTALLAQQQQWGLFNQAGWQSEHTPIWQWILLLVLLDLVIWAQHLLFHKVPWLWRLHRVHHTDTELDVSSALRFHPLEILLSMLIKAVVIVSLGIPAQVVLLFEIILNGLAMFNHANIELPPPLEKRLRWLLVTPDMHRVHHSWYQQETDSNYGFNLSCWDRLFGTYVAQPRDGHQQMAIGLLQFRSAKNRSLLRLLMQPLRRSEWEP